TSCRQYYAPGLDLDRAPIVFHAHALDAIVVGNKRHSPRVIGDMNAIFARDPGVCINKSGPAAPGFNRQPAPKLELAVDLVSLASIDRNETDAFALHPSHRFLAASDEQFAQIGIGAVFGDTPHIVEELVFGVGAKIGIGNLFIGQIGHQRAQIINAIVDAAKGTGSETAIAPGFFFRRALDHQDRNAMLTRDRGRAKTALSVGFEGNPGGVVAQNPKICRTNKPFPMLKAGALCNQNNHAMSGVLAVICVVVWIYLLAGRGNFWLCCIRDTGRPVPELRRWPVVVVVVPARNESKYIAASVRSLL